MLSAPPARSKQPTLRIATCQAQLLSEARPGPPNCPPKLRPRPITGGAKSYRCACHWTAAAGHHAIPAAMWTVSLVKSNHLSGKQPGEAPPWETMFRCGSSAGWPGRVWKIADLSTLADLIGSLPRSSFGSDQSVLPSVHSDGTHTHTRRDSQASAAVLLCCSATLLLCSSGQLHRSVNAIQGRFSSQGSLSFIQLDHPPNPADVTVGAPPRAPCAIPHPARRNRVDRLPSRPSGVYLAWLGWLCRKLHSNCKMRSWH